MAKFCPNCGNPVREGAAFCAKCGSKLRPSNPAPAEAAPAAPAAPVAPVAEAAPVVEAAPVEAAPADTVDNPKRNVSTGKKVAIIGAGQSGMTADRAGTRHR